MNPMNYENRARIDIPPFFLIFFTRFSFLCSVLGLPRQCAVSRHARAARDRTSVTSKTKTPETNYYSDKINVQMHPCTWKRERCSRCHSTSHREDKKAANTFQAAADSFPYSKKSGCAVCSPVQEDRMSRCTSSIQDRQKVQLHSHCRRKTKQNKKRFSVIPHSKYRRCSVISYRKDRRCSVISYRKDSRCIVISYSKDRRCIVISYRKDRRCSVIWYRKYRCSVISYRKVRRCSVTSYRKVTRCRCSPTLKRRKCWTKKQAQPTHLTKAGKGS